MNEKPPYLDDEDWEEVQQRLQPERRAKNSGAQEPPDRDAPPIGEATDSSASSAEGEGVRLEDFVAYMQTHDYIFKPAGDFWPAARINARLPKVKLFDGSGQPVIDEDTGEQKEIKPSVWLASHAAVEQMTWAPGLPQLIEDKLINEGGWIDRKGVTVFNLYRPLARLEAGRPSGDNGPVKVTERPKALTIARILYAGNPDAGLADWLRDRKNRRVIPHRMEQCGYVSVRNDAASDGLFPINGRRQVVYGRSDLSVSDRLSAAEAFVRRESA